MGVVGRAIKGIDDPSERGALGRKGSLLSQDIMIREAGPYEADDPFLTCPIDLGDEVQLPLEFNLPFPSQSLELKPSCLPGGLHRYP